MVTGRHRRRWCSPCSAIRSPGAAHAQNDFACSTDNTIYFGPGNLEKIVQSGDGAVKFTAAHEIGHHVQFMLDPSFATSYSGDTVADENQATCMAGVWFTALDAAGSPSDVAWR